MEIVPGLKPRLTAGTVVNSDLKVKKVVGGHIEIVRTSGERDVDVTARTELDTLEPGSSYTVLRADGRIDDGSDQGKGEGG